MTIVATARAKRRNYRVAQTREHAFTLAAVVQGILAESCRQRIACGCGYPCDAKVGAESLAVGFGALLPFRRRVPPLG